jgi:hypothetical protein
MPDDVVNQLNAAAIELQKTEFRRARTPDEWRRLSAKQATGRDYTGLFNAVVPVIQAFGEANASDRALIASRLNHDALSVLRIFASSIPVLAVRRDSPTLARQGLTAVAILGEFDDVRDLTYYLAALHYSAIRLRIDTQTLFADAAVLVRSTHLQSEMRMFPFRAPKDRSLAAFGFRETLTDGEFDLIQDSE